VSGKAAPVCVNVDVKTAPVFVDMCLLRL
jgi:hypothetical protein